MGGGPGVGVVVCGLVAAGSVVCIVFVLTLCNASAVHTALPGLQAAASPPIAGGELDASAYLGAMATRGQWFGVRVLLNILHRGVIVIVA